MSYPWWHVPYLTSPMVIALIAVIHVLVSHYAVGGGILLAVENRRAIKKEDKAYRAYLKRHAQFFVLLTVVFGAITGVGIWWTIGLASPLATETLIRTFVFGWAIEWVFFIVEIVAAFAFYYFWDRLPAQTHIKIGFIYALAAWISLVLITGITAFMLNSRGLFGDWAETGSFWRAFFNRQFLPQTVARTGGALIFATFYVWLHAAWTEKENALRERIIRRMVVPAFVGIGLLIAGVIGWLIFLPVSSKMMLERAAAMNIFGGLFLALLCGMTLLIVVGPLRAPGKVTVPAATALFLFGIAAVGTAEFVREAVRKPFIVDRIVYGNQIYAGQVGEIARNGLLNSGVWTRRWLDQLQEKYPDLKIAPPAAVAEPIQSAAFTGTPSDEALPTQYRPRQPIPQQRVQTPQTAPQRSQTPQAVPRAQPGSLPNQPLPSEPLPATPAPLNQTPAFTPISGEQPVAPEPKNDQENKSADEPENESPLPAARPVSEFVLGELPDPDVPRPGNEDLLRMSDEDKIETGRVIFMHHCNDCHAAERGYSAAAPMLTGKTEEEIVTFVRHLNRPGFYMPPWCGNDVEARLLAQYLLTIRPEMPSEKEPEPVSEAEAGTGTETENQAAAEAPADNK